MNGKLETFRTRLTGACSRSQQIWAADVKRYKCNYKSKGEDRAEPFNVVAGDKIWVLASKEATQGYEVFLQEGLPGSGPRSHSHDWDETFIVIDGDLTFSINGEEMTAKAGTLVHLPAGTPHEFKIGENGATMISITGSGSNASSLFSELAAENLNNPPSQKKLIEIIAKNGMHITPDENDL